MGEIEYSLDGLKGNVLDVTKAHLEQAKYDGDNAVVKQCLYPSIRYIITKIIDDEKCFEVIKSNHFNLNANDIIKLVDVNEITEQLVDFCENYLPHANKYLSSIDAQAESIMLFCHNYVFGLIKKFER